MTASYQTLDWYEVPHYYDLVFDVDTQREADFLERLHEHFGPSLGRARSGRVLEPACGSGRLVVEMARRNWRVEGSDLSSSMLDYARERLRKAKLERRARLSVADMAALTVAQPVHLAHCGVSTFKYLRSETEARAHLECVARALVPGGIYALGFHLTDYEDAGKSRERWVVEKGAVSVICNIQGWPADRRQRTEQVRSRLTVTEAGVERRSETVWTFRTYDARQVRGLLRSVPALEHIATYDFTYDIERPRELDDEQLDIVLLLRRRY